MPRWPVPRPDPESAFDHKRRGQLLTALSAGPGAKIDDTDFARALSGAWQAMSRQRDDVAEDDAADAGAVPPVVGRLRWTGQFPSPLMQRRWDDNPWLPLTLQWQITWQPGAGLEGWSLNSGGTGFDGRPAASGERQLHQGSTLLTPAAVATLSDRIGAWNRQHPKQGLRDLQAALGSMALLGQSLGGLTDQWLGRGAGLELPPLDPGADGAPPRRAGISDRVDDIEWPRPLQQSAMLPLRAGEMGLQWLRVVDAFGQRLDIQAQSDDRPIPLALPLRLRVEAGSGAVRLEPRLAQAARLVVEWPDAGAGDSEVDDDMDGNPFCGWLLPNLLDDGLMVYDAAGRALGGLAAVRRRARPGESVESFHWIDLPGSDGFFFGRPSRTSGSPLAGRDVDPDLRAMVDGLLGLTDGSGQAFAGLLDLFDADVGGGNVCADTADSNLALLMGRPLALVRARLRLELDGDPVTMPGADPDQPGADGDVEALEFALRLGRRGAAADPRDGLAGYFLRRDYARFYPAWGLDGPAADPYNHYLHQPSVSLAQPLELTLLIDPARGFGVTSGILPQRRFRLPNADLAEALRSRELMFYTGPVLAPERPSVNQDDKTGAVVMPRPSDRFGQWSWTHHPAVTTWAEQTVVDSGAELSAFAGGDLELREGWLRLVTEPFAITGFGVAGIDPTDSDAAESDGLCFDTLAGESLVLDWAVTGADALELWQDGRRLFRSRLQPLPNRRRVRVERSTDFTLKAFAREPGTAAGRLHEVREATIQIRTESRTG